MGLSAVSAARRAVLLSMVVAVAGSGCATRSVWDVPVRSGDGAAQGADTGERRPDAGPSPLPLRLEAPVAVIIDDPHNAYLEVLQVFSAELGRPYQIFNLAHRSPDSVRRELGELAPMQAVVVGARALEVAAGVPGVEVVHSGVLAPGRPGPGVDALPPFPVQLDYWLALSPHIGRIGVMGSPAVADRIDALAAACAERGLALERREVGSDKEALVAFRAMVPRIDGFVFLPDREVLSPHVIEQVLKHGRRNDVQMLVYSPLMYELGGSLFVQPDPVMVATALIDLLADPAADATVAEMRVRSRLHPPVSAVTAAEPAHD